MPSISTARAMSSFHVSAATRNAQYQPQRRRDANRYAARRKGMAIVSGCQASQHSHCTDGLSSQATPKASACHWSPSLSLAKR